MITVLSLTSLGFFLGMRHATDPDHAIAVSASGTTSPSGLLSLGFGLVFVYQIGVVNPC